MRLFHGTKHPYRAGDLLVPGGIVAACARSDDGEPVAGCGCGCDARRMLWATADLQEATLAAQRRACTCPSPGLDHRPRVFEVALHGVEADPNSWSAASVMGSAGRVLREVDLDEDALADPRARRT